MDDDEDVYDDDDDLMIGICCGGSGGIGILRSWLIIYKCGFRIPRLIMRLLLNRAVNM